MCTRSHALRVPSRFSFLLPPLVPAFPIDHIAQRPAVEIGAQVVAEEVDRAVPVFVAGARDMRRDQYPGVGPQPRRRRMLEFTDIDIECGTAQMTAVER